MKLIVVSYMEQLSKSLGHKCWNLLCLFRVEPLPRVFDMLQYFEAFLPLVERLRSSQQYEVYSKGSGAAGGL